MTAEIEQMEVDGGDQTKSSVLPLFGQLGQANPEKRVAAATENIAAKKQESNQEEDVYSKCYARRIWNKFK